ncbi:MAG: SAF domain-containing protein [Caulobacteraceae bacterium]
MVAARDLPAGHVLTEADIDFRIPVEAKITPNALQPYWLDHFIGKTLVKPVPAQDIIGNGSRWACVPRTWTAEDRKARNKPLPIVPRRRGPMRSALAERIGAKLDDPRLRGGDRL